MTDDEAPPTDPFVTKDGYRRVAMKPNTAAEVMDVGRSTIFNWIRAGRLRVFREGNLTLISAEDLAKLFYGGAPAGDGA